MTTAPDRGSVIRIPWLNKSRYDALSSCAKRPGVYTVYEKSGKHQRLAEIVLKYGNGDTLTTPRAAGAETLKRLIPALAKIVGVKGEVDAESVSARTVTGGVHLHLRAQSVGEVMHFDLKNQPAPGVPFYVTPGHGARKVLTRHEGETVAVARDLAAGAASVRRLSRGACRDSTAWSVTETHWESKTLQTPLSKSSAMSMRSRTASVSTGPRATR